MIRVVRSELVRLRAPGFVLGGGGLMTFFAVLATAVVFFTAGSGTASLPRTEGVTMALVEAPDGMFAGLQLFVNMLGVVALVVWAMSVTSDYSSGLIRLLVQAEPRRLLLLGGKVLSLVLFTLAATLVATMVVVAVSPGLASVAGVSTDAWDIGLTGTVLTGYVQVTLSVLLWGMVGLLVGVLTRSTGIAVGIGIGYLLVFEGAASMLLEGAGKWLPGSAFTAIASGGTSDLRFGAAVALGALYGAAALVVSAIVVRRRDITS
jgi:ABC-2 type transport system permease protein